MIKLKKNVDSLYPKIQLKINTKKSNETTKKSSQNINKLKLTFFCSSFTRPLRDTDVRGPTQTVKRGSTKIFSVSR